MKRWLWVLLFCAAPLAAQDGICTEQVTLRSATCPAGTSCSSKGTALTAAEFDDARANVAELCAASDDADPGHTHTTTSISGLLEADIADLSHTTDTGPSPDCSGTSTYQDGEGGCDAVGGDISGGLDAVVVANDSHDHTGSTLSGVDISDDTNLTAGTGATLTGDTLSVDLGVAIDSSEITDNEILEADLKAVDAAGDEECLTYEATGGDFEWQTCGSGGAPADADYLVGTANGDLSAEIVVGTAPQGELGGTWGSPTVDATHSGSAHHDAVTVSGTPDYITLSGQDIVRGTVDISDDTNLTGGAGVDMSGDSVVFDPSEVGTATWLDNADRNWTFDIAAAGTNPRIGFASAAIELDADVAIDNEQGLFFKENDSNGENTLSIQAPAIVTSNQVCVLENDAQFIPDSCVGDGVDDDTPDNDSEVPNAITVSGGSVDNSPITLDTGANPTTDGQIRWDSTTERIEVGDDGVATLEFYPGAHTSAHGNGANCAAGEIPLGVDDAGAVEGCYEPTEADISDLAHTATAITDGLIVEADLNEDSGTPTDEDVLTYDSTGANFNWVAQSTLAAGTSAALAANGGNCSAGEIPLGVDAAGSVEGCYEPTEADISDLSHNATAITDGLIVEADLNEDSGTPTDEDVLTYDTTGANFNWVAQSTLAAGTAAALAANGANCSASQAPLGVDASGAVESCTDFEEELTNSAGLRAALSDEVGTGAAVFESGAPTLTGTNFTGIPAGAFSAAAIDGDDINSNIAGRSLTLTAGSPDTLDADTELYTDGFSFVLADPVAGDSGEVQTEAFVTLTVTNVRCSTDTGTVTLNIEERVESTPNTAGVDILSADLVADTNSQDSCASGCDVNTIQNQPIDQNDPIVLTITSVASSPTWLRCHVRYTVDD